MTRSAFKLYEAMNLLRTGKPATLEVCSLDLNRPGKSGKPIKLIDVVYISSKGLTQGRVRLANGELQAIHPCLILKYNGTPVTP